MARAATPEEREERRNVVASMMLAHAQVTVMARTLSVDRHTIQTDIQAIRDDWKARRTEAYDRYTAEELPKLEALERAMWDKAMEGNGWAVDRVLAIMDQRARYIGLYAPLQERITVITEETVDAAIAERRAKLELLQGSIVASLSSAG